MTGASARPEVDFKVGAVRVAVWRNTYSTGSGKVFDSPKVALERTYRDSQGNFKTTGSLDTNDIPKAILALKKAYEYLTTKANERKESNGNIPPETGEPLRLP